MAVRLENAFVVPGEFSRYRRRVQLDLRRALPAPEAADDFSGAGLGAVATDTPAPRIPVYDFAPASPFLLGGLEPSPGYIRWRRRHFNNTHERAGEVALIAERIGGILGAVAARIAVRDGTARAGADF